MRLKKILGISLTILVVMSFTIYSNGQKETSKQEGKKQTINVWHWYDKMLGEAYDNAVKAFEVENPNIVVESSYFPFSEFNQKLLLGMASGDLPEIALIHSNQVITLGSSDKTVKINERFPELLKEAKTDLLNGPYKMGSVGKNFVAVPYLAATMGMIYNKELFEEQAIAKPPKNWAEWIDISKKLNLDKNGDGKTDQWGTLFWGHPYSTYAFALFEYHFMYANNLPSYVFDDSGVPIAQFDKPLALKSLSFLNDMINKYKVVKVGGDMKEDFMAKKGAMVVGEATHVNQYLARVPDMKLATCHDPSYDGNGYSMIAGHLAMIFKSNKNKETSSAKFVSFFTLKPEINAQFLIKTGNFATSHLTAEVKSYQQWMRQNEYLKTFSDLVKTATPYVNIKGQPEINSRMTELIQEVVLQKKTPKEALSILQKEASDIIKKYYK